VYCGRIQINVIYIRHGTEESTRLTHSLSAVSKPHSHAILRQQCTMYILLIAKGITAVKWLDTYKPIINYMELIKSLYDDIFNELLICINV
jgi:hypothetical protein